MKKKKNEWFPIAKRLLSTFHQFKCWGGKWARRSVGMPSPTSPRHAAWYVAWLESCPYDTTRACGQAWYVCVEPCPASIEPLPVKSGGYFAIFLQTPPPQPPNGYKLAVGGLFYKKKLQKISPTGQNGCWGSFWQFVCKNLLFLSLNTSSFIQFLFSTQYTNNL